MHSIEHILRARPAYINAHLSIVVDDLYLHNVASCAHEQKATWNACGAGAQLTLRIRHYSRISSREDKRITSHLSSAL